MMHYLGFVADGEVEAFPSDDLIRQIGSIDETLVEPYRSADMFWRMGIAGLTPLTCHPREGGDLVPMPKNSRLRGNDNDMDWYESERSRMAMVLKNYQSSTLLLLVVPFLVMDLALLSIAIHEGWWREKVRAMVWLWKPSTWGYLLKRRQQIAHIRQVPDRLVFSEFVSKMPLRLYSTDPALRIIQPFLEMYFQLVKMMIGFQR